MTATPSTPVTSLSFFRFFANLRDPRRVCRTTYRFLDLIFIALAATIAGANDPQAIAVFAHERRVWLQKYCTLPIDPKTGEILAPSHDTFERLLKRLNPAAFARCFGRWTSALAESLGLKHIAIRSPVENRLVVETCRHDGCVLRNGTVGIVQIQSIFPKCGRSKVP